MVSDDEEADENQEEVEEAPIIDEDSSTQSEQLEDDAERPEGPEEIDHEIEQD